MNWNSKRENNNIKRNEAKQKKLGQKDRMKNENNQLDVKEWMGRKW